MRVNCIDPFSCKAQKNQGHRQRGVSNLIFKKKIYRYMKFSTIYTGYIAKFLVLTNRFVSKYQYLQTVRLGMSGWVQTLVTLNTLSVSWGVQYVWKLLCLLWNCTSDMKKNGTWKKIK